jgi:hypothetical protein
MPAGDVLSGIEFQRNLERRAFELGGGNYHAPAQLLGDFLACRASTGPGKVLPSYEPGVVWTDLRECLPEYTIETIQEAIPRINKSLPGFALEDAVMTGVETRSSSPTRIPRDAHVVLLDSEAITEKASGPAIAVEGGHLLARDVRVSGYGSAVSKAVMVLLLLWAVLAARITLALVRHESLSGDLSLPACALFAVSAVLASRVWLRFFPPTPTDETAQTQRTPRDA